MYCLNFHFYAAVLFTWDHYVCSINRAKVVHICLISMPFLFLSSVCWNNIAKSIRNSGSNSHLSRRTISLRCFMFHPCINRMCKPTQSYHLWSSGNCDILFEQCNTSAIYNYVKVTGSLTLSVQMTNCVLQSQEHRTVHLYPETSANRPLHCSR